jgi:coenzyme F420-0:L-glutamate ligase
MIEIIPVRIRIEANAGINFLAKTIAEHAKSRDIIVVSSKAVSYCEGRLVKLSDVKPSSTAVKLASHYSLSPEIAELVLREAESIIGGGDGFVLAVKHGVLAPNAGIDTSNVPDGFAILYPENPQKSADEIRKKVEEIIGGRVGVVIADSRILPLRRGVTGIAIASSGFEAVSDERGKPDLYGKPLTVTFRNVADMLASASQLVMGEANEMIPVVIVRGLNTRFVDEEYDLSVKAEECLYVKAFREGLKWSK